MHFYILLKHKSHFKSFHISSIFSWTRATVTRLIIILATYYARCFRCSTQGVLFAAPTTSTFEKPKHGSDILTFHWIGTWNQRNYIFSWCDYSPIERCCRWRDSCRKNLSRKRFFRTWFDWRVEIFCIFHFSLLIVHSFILLRKFVQLLGNTFFSLRKFHSRW